MSHIEKKLKKAAQSVKLSSTEKDAMRSRLLTFMNTEVAKPTPSPFMRWIEFTSHIKTQYVSALLVILLIGGGVSLAAEQSLPGEALYQVKSFNENLRAFFTVTPQSKAQLQTELAVRRLEEVEQLAVQGKLSTSTKENVEKNLDDHIAAIKDNVKALENNDQIDLAADTASQAEISLKAHSAILDVLAQKNKDVKDVAQKVTVEASSVAIDRASIDATLASSTMPIDLVQAKQKQAQAVIDDVMNILNGTTTSATSTVATSTPSNASTTPAVTEKINQAQDSMVKGKAKLDKKVYGAAFIFFQKAERVATETKLLLQAKQDLNIQVPTVTGDDATSTATTSTSTATSTDASATTTPEKTATSTTDLSATTSTSLSL